MSGYLVPGLEPQFSLGCDGSIEIKVRRSTLGIGYILDSHLPGSKKVVVRCNCEARENLDAIVSSIEKEFDRPDRDLEFNISLVRPL